MSAHDFQIVLAKLIASPELCEKTIADEAAVFADFILTDREKRRLHAILRQRGISACCSLYRMNRVTPVYAQLSNTSAMLGDDFIPIIEEFWKHLVTTSLQFKEEVLAFGNFLLGKIENGTVSRPYLKEVLLLEITLNELNYIPEGECRLLKFEHDIFSILQSLAAGTLESSKIRKSGTVYKIYMKDQTIEMDELTEQIYAEYWFGLN